MGPTLVAMADVEREHGPKRVASRAVIPLITGVAGIASTAASGGNPFAGLVVSTSTAAALQELKAARAERATARLEGALELASREAGLDAATLIETLEATPAGEDLLVRTLRIAQDAGVGEKLLIASRALASGALAKDDAEVELEVLMMRAVQDLDMVHFRLLHKFTMSATELGLQETPEHTSPPSALNPLQLVMVAPELEDVIPTLTAVLQSHGLLEAIVPGATWADPKIKLVQWRITQQGQILVDRMRAVGEAAGG